MYMMIHTYFENSLSLYAEHITLEAHLRIQTYDAYILLQGVESSKTWQKPR